MPSNKVQVHDHGSGCGLTYYGQWHVLHFPGVPLSKKLLHIVSGLYAVILPTTLSWHRNERLLSQNALLCFFFAGFQSGGVDVSQPIVLSCGGAMVAPR